LGTTKITEVVEDRSFCGSDFDGALLSTSNVSGSGLPGAKPIEKAELTKLPDPILPPTGPYELR
jgi:hypothetical protein